MAPERVAKLKVVSVCLEHGKKDPNPQVAYDLVPLESFVKDAKVIELVKMLGRGEIDRRAAQAAAWHQANQLSWQELADKIGAKHISGATEPYFFVRRARPRSPSCCGSGSANAKRAAPAVNRSLVLAASKKLQSLQRFFAAVRD